MRINKTVTNREYETKRKSTPEFKGAREIFSKLTSDGLVSTLVLEIPCDIGRGANAYKRGGKTELRERLTEDTISALFWMKGADMFNKVGDLAGKHLLKLPETEFDVGKDALRTPFENLINSQQETQNLTQEAGKKLAKKLAGFKFAKVISSALLAAGFMGFIVPKLNQNITSRFMKKKSENEENNLFDKHLKQISIEEFDKKISQKSTTSFKGIGLTGVTYLLENNPICKMLASDSGMITGRVLTARNKDEGREYLFRDLASSFFYYASVPLMYKGFQKLTGSTPSTETDAVCSKQLHENLKEKLLSSGGKMNVEEFIEGTIGKIDDSGKALLEKLPFNSDVISLNELKKYITDEKLIQKATKMAKLQPEQAKTGAVLTKQQVADVLKNGSVNTPEFMESVYTKRFGKDLTDPYKYIPMKKITTFRDNMDNYVKNIADKAKQENNGIIDEKLLERIQKTGFAKSVIFRTIAITVSALSLAILIPKMQYAITARRTGKNEPPGLREYKIENK